MSGKGAEGPPCETKLSEGLLAAGSNFVRDGIWPPPYESAKSTWRNAPAGPRARPATALSSGRSCANPLHPTAPAPAPPDAPTGVTGPAGARATMNPEAGGGLRAAANPRSTNSAAAPARASDGAVQGPGSPAAVGARRAAE